ncbi:MAG: hypothetical protein M1828_006972 [Chrysothrix sp. TS-e1954]|nr:MAG: hypothetical protein M1828_006972 [Chrysothrix sp. TS-e1954]
MEHLTKPIPEPGPSLSTQPPPHPTYVLSYPRPHALLITIDRPKALNSLPYASHWEAEALLGWFDGEPSLRVAVVTGAGDKAFCAGQDLIEQNEIAMKHAQGGKDLPPTQMLTHPKTGFMGISRRGNMGKKPIIAAVNGYAMGGGFEIVLGCDMVVASPNARFALPEASRGLYAAAGGLSRLVRLVGLPLASEIAMAGRQLTPQEALNNRIINLVSKSQESLVEEALTLAQRIGDLSPDAIIVTRSGLRESLEQGSVERASQATDERFGRGLREGENIRIGLAAFAQKQKPAWVPSKL